MTFELGPGLLLAAPRLADPNFEKTVVLLGRHESEGSLGWVLNGQSLGVVGDLLHSAELVPSGTRLPMTGAFERLARRGGPVQPESGWMLYAAGRDPLPGEIRISPTLAITGDVDSFSRMIAGKGPADFKILLGYAGWAPGQLEHEVQAGAWLPAPLDADLVLREDVTELWTDAYLRATGTAPAAFSGQRGQA